MGQVGFRVEIRFSMGYHARRKEVNYARGSGLP